MTRRADVAFAVAACAVLAGYNNLAGLAPWHRRWYPAVNACAAAATAGTLLSVLRQRSGSLAAPVLLHLAANATAPLASALARTRSSRGVSARPRFRHRQG